MEVAFNTGLIVYWLMLESLARNHYSQAIFNEKYACCELIHFNGNVIGDERTD